MNYTLQIQDYLTIKEHTLDLTPGVEGFVGKNAQGKTNFLKAIQALLDTKNDPSKIKDGADKYVVQLNMYNDKKELIAYIKRVQTEKRISLTSKGLPANTTPAAFLAHVLDSKMLNPLRLIQDDPVAYLKKHLPSKLQDGDLPESFVKMEAEIKEENGFDYCVKAAQHVSALRVDIGRQVKQAEGALADLRVGMPEKQPEAPYDRSKIDVLMSGLRDQLSTITTKQEHKNSLQKQFDDGEEEISTQRRGIAVTEKNINTYKEEIAVLNSKISQLEANIKIAVEYIDKKQADQEELMDKINTIQIPDASVINGQIESEEGKLRELESHENTVKRFQVVEQRQKSLDDLKKQYEDHDKLYKHFAYDLPKTLITRCKLPVDGLIFKDDKMYVGERPIDLLSEAEKAIVATQLAAALAKQKGQIAISLDGVEMMDKEHRDVFIKIAKESGLKIFYTRLGNPEAEHELEVIDGVAVKKGETDGKIKDTNPNG